MSNKLVKCLQKLSSADPSLSELMSTHLNELCGEEVEFFAVILAENNKKQLLVTTAGMLNPNKAHMTIEHLIEALRVHGDSNAPPEAQAYAHFRPSKNNDGDGG